MTHLFRGQHPLEQAEKLTPKNPVAIRARDGKPDHIMGGASAPDTPACMILSFPLFHLLYKYQYLCL
jgi:hypothetical protein